MVTEVAAVVFNTPPMKLNTMKNNFSITVKVASLWLSQRQDIRVQYEQP